MKTFDELMADLYEDDHENLHDVGDEVVVTDKNHHRHGQKGYVNHSGHLPNSDNKWHHKFNSDRHVIMFGHGGGNKFDHKEIMHVSQIKKTGHNILEDIQATDEILEEGELVIAERHFVRRIRAGKMQRKLSCDTPGMKNVGNRCIRMGSKERLNRRMAQRKTKRTKAARKGRRRMSNFKRQRSLRLRKARGLK